MTNVPDPNPHAAHDLELIAALAAGDAVGRERNLATAQLDACAECTRLYADLAAISAAMAELPVPTRTRDFRLTAEQAADLRPRGWRGMLVAIAGPRFAFAAPLGTAMATLGLVALLLAGPGLPIASSSPASDAALGPTTEQAVPETVAGAAVPSPAPEAASPATGADLAPANPGASTEPGLGAAGYGAASPAAGATAPGAAAGSDTSNAAPGSTAERNGASTVTDESAGLPSTVLLLVSGLVLLAGVALVALRLIARRAA